MRWLAGALSGLCLAASAAPAHVESLASKPDGAFSLALRFAGNDDELALRLVHCRVLRVFGGPDRAAPSLSHRQHSEGLARLQRARDAGRLINFAWADVGPRVVNKAYPCTVRSTGLVPASGSDEAVLARSSPK
jgi:hypothetical protein